MLMSIAYQCIASCRLAYADLTYEKYSVDQIVLQLLVVVILLWQLLLSAACVLLHPKITPLLRNRTDVVLNLSKFANELFISFIY